MYIKQEYYDVLNSSRTDSLDTIKKNYKTLCLKHHPDVGGSEKYMKKINLAMEIINEFHTDSDNKESFKSNKTNKKQTHKKYTKGNSANGTKHTKNTRKSNKNKEHKCPKCGFHDPDAFNYCINCGYKFGSIDKKMIILFIVGIILFYGVSKILALIYLIWLYKHYK